MSDTDFQLHQQLAQDCFELGYFPLCRVLLMNDCNYPWFILVPARQGIVETYQLNTADQQQLWIESAAFGAHIMQQFQGEKLNIAALGNVVPQLHIHHIVRYADDPAWPAPVWGKHPAKPYSDDALQACLAQLGERLPAGFCFTASI
ncbi:MAG: HIT domain-containing protein [Gammaproteobacteria bacterium]|nr:HIT domain-containing protein [Gammaproteobacteria bacterium]MDH5653765.1 HIT domain-containing protein [Gammaproteobacteria bacterium]